MDKAIERASIAGATASHVIKPVISENADCVSYKSSAHNLYLSNPTNSALYFSALSSNPSFLVGGCYHGGIVGLLLLVTPQFLAANQKSSDTVSVSVALVTEEQASLYLRAAAAHVDAILDEWNCGRISNRNVEDISKALANAAKICCQNGRSLISSSGIIPALAKLITGYQSHKALLLSSASNSRKSSTSNAVATVTQTQDNTESLMARNFLTPVHAEFLQITILAGHYRLASIFVQRHPVHAVDQYSLNYDSSPHDPRNASATNKIGSNLRIKRSSSSSSSSKLTPLLSSESFLRYFYYLGMVHLGCDDYPSALSAFEVCLKVPASVISTVVIAARKKILLARCLALALDDEEEYLSSSSTASYTRNIPAGGRDENSGGNMDEMKRVLCPLSRKLMGLPRGLSPKVTDFFEEAERLPNDCDTDNFLSKWAACDDDRTKSCSSKSNKTDDSAYLPTSHGMLYYHLLVSSFAKCDVSSILKLIQTGAYTAMPISTVANLTNIGDGIGILKQDGNMGLAQRLVPAIKHRILKSLGRIYEAISLDKFNQKLSVLGCAGNIAPGSNSPLGEDWLMHLTLKKREESCSLSPHTYSSSFQTPFLEFTIDLKNHIVHFFQDGHDEKESETKFDSGVLVQGHGLGRENAQTKLAKRIAICMDLAERVTQLDAGLATSVKYQAQMIKDSGSSGSGTGGGDEGGGEGSGGGPRSVMDYYTHGIP